MKRTGINKIRTVIAVDRIELLFINLRTTKRSILIQHELNFKQVP
jgi:hypothetical protein